MTFGVNPGAGYRVNRWLSVGAGFSVLYVNFDQKAAVNNSAVPGQAGQSGGNLEIGDDDVGCGFNLGLMPTPRDGTRFGLAAVAFGSLTHELFVNIVASANGNAGNANGIHQP
jgi:long-chain fatty acid transport protein